MQVADIPKQVVPLLMSACHGILESDTEENGMHSQRILFEVHKTYKQALEEQSKPFFAWLEKVRKTQNTHTHTHSKQMQDIAGYTLF